MLKNAKNLRHEQAQERRNVPPSMRVSSRAKYACNASPSKHRESSLVRPLIEFASSGTRPCHDRILDMSLAEQQT